MGEAGGSDTCRTIPGGGFDDIFTCMWSNSPTISGFSKVALDSTFLLNWCMMFEWMTGHDSSRRSCSTRMTFRNSWAFARWSRRRANSLEMTRYSFPYAMAAMR